MGSLKRETETRFPPPPAPGTAVTSVLHEALTDAISPARLLLLQRAADSWLSTQPENADDLARELGPLRAPQNEALILKKFSGLSAEAKTVFLARAITEVEAITRQALKYNAAAGREEIEEYSIYFARLVNGEGIPAALRQRAASAFDAMAEAAGVDLRMHKLDDGAWIADEVNDRELVKKLPRRLML
jgi:hypothetical protein